VAAQPAPVSQDPAAAR